VGSRVELDTSVAFMRVQLLESVAVCNCGGH
jgi:hypothetical protein